ncbi:MAG: hypothetical protein HYV32_02845 [Candidatus Kerfeldbacteria bacterium]|nr:hypothetical protein [Candidatus Kerfeldbacteria bacterium]
MNVKVNCSLFFSVFAICFFFACAQHSPPLTEATPTPVPVFVPVPEITPMETGAHHVILDIVWPDEKGGDVWCEVNLDPSDASFPSVSSLVVNIGQYEIYYLLPDADYTCYAKSGESTGEVSVRTEPDVPALQGGFQLAGTTAKDAPGYVFGHVSFYDWTNGLSFTGCVLVDQFGQIRAAVEVAGGFFICELLPHGREEGGRPEALISAPIGTGCVPENTYPEYESAKMSIPENSYKELPRPHHHLQANTTSEKTIAEGGSGWYGSSGGSTCGYYGYGSGVTRVDLRGEVLMQAEDVAAEMPEVSELGVYYDSHDAEWTTEGYIQALTSESCVDGDTSWMSFGRAIINPESGQVEQYWSGCVDGLAHGIDSPLTNEDDSVLPTPMETPADGDDDATAGDSTPYDNSTPEPEGEVTCTPSTDSPTPWATPSSGDDDSTYVGTPTYCSYMICNYYGCYCGDGYYGGGSDYYHANTICDDEDSFFIGAKHRNYIAAVSKTTGEVGYFGVDQGYALLYPDGSWASDSKWFFHAHDARISGDILTAHNNGTGRQDYDPTDPEHSSLSVYKLDREQKTATLLLDWVPAPNGVPDYYWDQDIYGGCDRFQRVDTDGHAVLGAIDSGIPFEDLDSGPGYRTGWPIIDETTGKMVRAIILPENASTYRARFVSPCNIPNKQFAVYCGE